MEESKYEKLVKKELGELYVLQCRLSLGVLSIEGYTTEDLPLVEMVIESKFWEEV